MVLSYQWLPMSIQCGEAMARRRKEDGRVGSASRGMVRRLGRFFSHVRPRGVPERERGPDRCTSSGAAVDVCSDAPAWAQRADRVADVRPNTSCNPAAMIPGHYWPCGPVAKPASITTVKPEGGYELPGRSTCALCRLPAGLFPETCPC